MAVKIRLARHGKKGAPVYHIVAADSIKKYFTIHRPNTRFKMRLKFKKYRRATKTN